MGGFSLTDHMCYCCSSVAQACPALWDPIDCITPGLSVPLHLPKFAKFISTALVMPSSRLILWHPRLLLPSIFPSIRDFSKESAVRIRWPKYWSFSFSISPWMSIQGWLPLRLTGLISLLYKGLSGVFSRTTVRKRPAFCTVQVSQLSSWLWPRPWLDVDHM